MRWILTPVSLAFFFVWLFVITLLKKVELGTRGGSADESILPSKGSA